MAMFKFYHSVVDGDCGCSAGSPGFGPPTGAEPGGFGPLTPVVLVVSVMAKDEHVPPARRHSKYRS